MASNSPTSTTTALPPVVDAATWRAALEDLRRREKAATRELDAIAAQRPVEFAVLSDPRFDAWCAAANVRLVRLSELH